MKALRRCLLAALLFPASLAPAAAQSAVAVPVHTFRFAGLPDAALARLRKAAEECWSDDYDSRVLGPYRQVAELPASLQANLLGALERRSFRRLGGKEEIQLKMDEVLVETNQRLDKNTGFLGTIANISTLLGLLGTIVGMIDAFSSLGAASATERAALLSQGISVAMYTTAYGLIVAIPSLAAYAVLQNRSQKLMEDLNKAAMKVYIWLTYSFESIPAVATAAKSKTTSKNS